MVYLSFLFYPHVLADTGTLIQVLLSFFTQYKDILAITLSIVATLSTLIQAVFSGFLPWREKTKGKTNITISINGKKISVEEVDQQQAEEIIKYFKELSPEISKEKVD